MKKQNLSKTIATLLILTALLATLLSCKKNEKPSGDTQKPNSGTSQSQEEEKNPGIGGGVQGPIIDIVSD